MTLPEKWKRSAWAHDSRGVREIQERYDAWAEEYEQDVASYGYRFPGIMTGLVSRYLIDQSVPILDAGCGTGILGELLSVLGYKDITGIDLSQGMLDVAGRKGIYQQLRQMELGKPLGFPDDSFGAFAAMGVLGLYAQAMSLDELVRVTRPGGYGIFTMNEDAYLNGGFKDKHDALEQEGKWRFVEVTKSFVNMPVAAPGRLRQVYVYQIL